MKSNWSYSPETPNLGQIRQFLEPCDLDIWQMTLKNNRAPLLNNIKLYASFHHHMWIQTWVTVWKRLSWVVTSLTLTLDLWPWPFTWTLPGLPLGFIPGVAVTFPGVAQGAPKVGGEPLRCQATCGGLRGFAPPEKIWKNGAIWCNLAHSEWCLMNQWGVQNML